MQIYTSSFYSGQIHDERGKMSPRKIFRVCRRIRKWWQRGELKLFRVPGLLLDRESLSEKSPITELCPWRVPENNIVSGEFWCLPRAGVEIYRLGITEDIIGRRVVVFFVFFDWYNNKDILGERIWYWKTPRQSQFFVISPAEWRATRGLS